jgi:hypothetical protein
MKNPATFFNRPVIGKIITKEISYTVTNHNNSVEKLTMSSDEFEIIAEEKTFYICNQWYKEYNNTPQLISKDMVESVTFYKEK